jgi:hypothetical protein
MYLEMTVASKVEDAINTTLEVHGMYVMAMYNEMVKQVDGVYKCEMIFLRESGDTITTLWYYIDANGIRVAANRDGKVVAHDHFSLIDYLVPLLPKAMSRAV